MQVLLLYHKSSLPDPSAERGVQQCSPAQPKTAEAPLESEREAQSTQQGAEGAHPRGGSGAGGQGVLLGAHRHRLRCEHGLWGGMCVRARTKHLVCETEPSNTRGFRKAGPGLADLCVCACVCSHVHGMRGRGASEVGWEITAT